MTTRTKVRTITAARKNGYAARFVSELKSRGVIEDPGWGYCYLEDVSQYRASHTRVSKYAQPTTQEHVQL